MSGWYKQFIKLLEKVADLCEQRDDKEMLYVVYSYIAQCYFRVENYRLCIVYCTKGLQIRYIKKYLHLRGDSFLKLNDFQSAIKDFENILQNHSDDEDARHQLGICQIHTANNSEPTRDVSALLSPNLNFEDIKKTTKATFNYFGINDNTDKLSDNTPAGRFYFLDEGLSILLDQVYPKDNKFHKILYESLALINIGAYSKAKDKLIKFNKTFNYYNHFEEIKMETTNEVLFHVIILKHLLLIQEAKNLLDKTKDKFAGEKNENVSQYVLYLIKRYQCIDFELDIMMLKRETKPFQDKLHKETIFFIDVQIAVQYTLADKWNEAHNYLLSLKYFGNTIYKPFFWILLAKATFFKHQINDSRQCLLLSSYFIFETKNIFWICAYYELLSYLYGTMHDYDRLHGYGETIQQILHNTILKNDNSTCTELLKIYDKVISPLCHGFEYTFIISCMYCKGNGCRFCYNNCPSLEKMKNLYAFQWSEFHKTRSWIHEPRIMTRMRALAHHMINIPENCACISYIPNYFNDNEQILCVILSSRGICNYIQLDYRTSIEKVWHDLDPVVENIDDIKALTFPKTLDDMKQLSNIYPIYVEPIKSYFLKIGITKIKIITKDDYRNKIIQPKILQQQNQYQIKEHCCYIEYSIDQSFHNQDSIKEIYCYVVLHDNTIRFKSIQIESYKQFKADIELVNWTSDVVSSTKILTEKRHKLYQILIEPISPILDEYKINYIKFVPDGVLTYFPFSNLLIDETKRIYLIDKYEILCVPSVICDQNMLIYNKNDIQIQQLSLFSSTVIHPDIEKKFNLLDEAGESYSLTKEIDELVDFFQKESINYDEPNKTTTKDNLIDYFTRLDETNLSTVFHYCGHTEFDEQKFQTKYALSGAMILQGDPADALFHSTDIAKYNLSNISLAVLNSCSTYKGKSTVSVSGHLGLSRAFYVAGVQCIIATLASEFEYATIFAEIFYKYIKQGNTVSSAFTQAIREFKAMDDSEYESPEYWGSFLLFGNGDITIQFKQS